MIKNSLKLNSQKGQALLEFALIAGLLLFILFGMIVVGYWMSAQQLVTSASRQGARAGALTMDNALVRGAVYEALKGIVKDPQKINVIIDPENPNDPGRKRGNYLTVKVTYEIPFGFKAFTDSTNGLFRTVTSTTSARIECNNYPKTCPNPEQ